MKEIIFADRAYAGQLLAGALIKYLGDPDLIVLGLPRGGVPVAYQVAKRLHAPLDVMVVRKLGVPGQEELAMGAVASGGVRVINEEVVWAGKISPETIDRVAAAELEELQRREIAFRGHAGAPEVKGRTVILVDDGIATGSTIHAAIQALHQQDPARIVIAVPVAAADSCARLEPMVDEIVSLLRPVAFHAVGQWYEDFQQTTDTEVSRLIEAAKEREAAH